MTFEAYFEEVHGHPPFPWQLEAARRLIHGVALDTVVIPTGLGKTAMLDAAIYHAMEGGPRRIFFIIDRRVVVDEAYERAKRIQKALAKRFPLRVVRLRGGVQGDQEWVWHPEETVIVLSTVDQVGSRLLFRGYGVSPRSWPVHAAMVGNRAVYIVDEAHQSLPFSTTVQTAIGMGADIRLIEMTATPRQDEGRGYLSLSEDDLAHPLIRRRIDSRKRATLSTADNTDQAFAASAAEHALALVKPGAVIGIVVNTINAARAVHDNIKREHEAILLIGRNRPFDRDRLMEEHFDRIRAGRTRSAEGAPLFIVATQTIEVGADIDFDALVTEAAPLSALRQRFGRVDRLGQLGETKSVVLARESVINDKTAEKTPVYGADVKAAWQWLQSIAEGDEVDFGLAIMTETLKAQPAPAESDVLCPALLPSHLLALSQTGTIAPKVSVAPWLHGPARLSTEVNIVWREDLLLDEQDTWVDRLKMLPPVARESVQVPLRSLRDLLTHRVSTELADSEGEASQRADWTESEELMLIWRGPDHVSVERGSAVRPGDTVVLPASYGGLDAYGWHPKSSEHVEDIAEVCVSRKVRRLSRSLPEVQALVAALDAIDAEDQQERIAAAETALLSSVEGPRNYSRIGEDIALIGKIVQEQAGALTAGVAVTLEDHHAGVASKARDLAEGHDHQGTIVSAGAVHDAGKVAPAFQAMLHGDPIHAAMGPVLAKSGLRDPKALQAAYRNSGLPRGFRHELYSVDLTADATPLEKHLIGTHHGYGRPWFPVCEDADAPGAKLAEIDAGWVDQFDRLQGESSPWKLADLEHLVRAADIQRTIEEQELTP